MEEKEVLGILYLCLLAVFLWFDSVLPTIRAIREARKKPSRPDTDKPPARKGWYFGRLKSIKIEGDKKVMTFEDGKVCSIPANDPFGDGCEGGEILRMYFDRRPVREQVAGRVEFLN